MMGLVTAAVLFLLVGAAAAANSSNSSSRSGGRHRRLVNLAADILLEKSDENGGDKWRGFLGAAFSQYANVLNALHVDLGPILRGLRDGGEFKKPRRTS